MSDRPSTFAGTWSRAQQDGIGQSRREVQDRASYDHDPAAGCSFLLILALPLAGLLLAALLHTTGVTA
ncbi:hypothetical protein OOK13_40425 [Streptomyces sp. NBC_00378]|uniref:hypothetical protein n=1 Tax=unclassified Streptomyces TaxID=2593676 RepID=UPI00225C1F3C|nr:MULTISPECIES: hypothetical protein [unclassified Streptomyces]MCX5112176.1 hypothetical protein [Streptomyces sp. NBC_00378]MCX5114629.1 hypothetical protein [Streptomyces sp. NBC_00378]